ncbi:MAG: YfiR family protein [Planctomycetales bacterium]|nr:YfiR family protein [Planctomycetales bacterium]
MIPRLALQIDSHRKRRAAVRTLYGGLRTRRGWLTVVLILVGVVIWPTIAGAQDVVDTRKEYNVKAAYLYSLGRYVSWPEETFAATQGSFVIGVLGETPLRTPLSHIAASRKMNGRPIQLVELDSVNDEVACHILFVSRGADASGFHSLEAASHSGVLIVGEQPGFAKAGGMVNFYLAGDSVKFEINVSAAQESGLRMDAKLLKLGRPVE